jgi:hypothetical protein
LGDILLGILVSKEAAASRLLADIPRIVGLAELPHRALEIPTAFPF